MAGFINMGFDTGNIDYNFDLFRDCPFCGATTPTKAFLNTVCLGCNSKYYPLDRLWLNRKTGEKIYVSKNYV